MRINVLHIVCIAAVMCLSACGSKTRIIPRSEMVDIYADMYIADQWVSKDFDEFKRADTLLFYEPIFNRYGYTTDDFRESMYHYLSDPRRFARILQRTATKLESLRKHLQAYKEVIDDISDTKARFWQDPGIKPYYDEDFMRNCFCYDIDITLDSMGRYIAGRPWLRTSVDTLLTDGPDEDVESAEEPEIQEKVYEPLPLPEGAAKNLRHVRVKEMDKVERVTVVE